MALIGALGALVAGACVLAALRSRKINGTSKVKTLKIK